MCFDNDRGQLPHALLLRFRRYSTAFVSRLPDIAAPPFRLSSSAPYAGEEIQWGRWQRRSLCSVFIFQEL